MCLFVRLYYESRVIEQLLRHVVHLYIYGVYQESKQFKISLLNISNMLNPNFTVVRISASGNVPGM